MIQASSASGSVRSASRGSSRGQPRCHQILGERHRAESEVAMVDHHLAPAREHSVARCLDDPTARCATGRPTRRREDPPSPAPPRPRTGARRPPGRQRADPRRPRCPLAVVPAPLGTGRGTRRRPRPPSRHTTLSALRAMCVSRCPTLQPGNWLGWRAAPSDRPASISSSALWAVRHPATQRAGGPASTVVTESGWRTARRACRP